MIITSDAIATSACLAEIINRVADKLSRKSLDQSAKETIITSVLGAASSQQPTQDGGAQ